MTEIKVGDLVYDKNLDLNGKVLSIVCDVVYILGFIDERAHKTNINALVKLDEVKDDNINHPHRYTKGKIECIDAIESAVCDLKGIEAFCTGNVIKYVWRWKEKEQVWDKVKEEFDELKVEIDHMDEEKMEAYVLEGILDTKNIG